MRILEQNKKTGYRARPDALEQVDSLRKVAVLIVVLLPVNVPARAVEIPFEDHPFTPRETVTRRSEAVFKTFNPLLLSLETCSFPEGKLARPDPVQNALLLYSLAAIDTAAMTVCLSVRDRRDPDHHCE
jgi:hypothetical protein